MTPRPSRDNFYVDTEYRVLHEDEDLIVVDKPAPLAVHAVGMYKTLNLQTLMQKDPRFAGVPIKTPHRLDAETSGLLVVAKNNEAASFMGRQFMGGHVKKVYEAIVFGCPSAPTGEINYSLGNDTSSGFQTVRMQDDAGGESACTRYEVLRSTDQYAHIRLTPLTGRTHQLRIHLALLGHPIVGDKIYVDLGLFERYVSGGLDEVILSRLKLPRLALHASEIAFAHPRSKTTVRYTAALPPLLSDFAAGQGL